MCDRIELCWMNLVTQITQHGLSFFRRAKSVRRTTCTSCVGIISNPGHRGDLWRIFFFLFLQMIFTICPPVCVAHSEHKLLPVGRNESSSWSSCDGLRRSHAASKFSFSATFYSAHSSPFCSCQSFLSNLTLTIEIP